MKQPPAASAPSRRRRFGRPGARRLGALALAGGALVVAGCAPDGQSRDRRHDPTGAVAAGLAVAPLDLGDVSASLADHYRFTAANHEVYSQVPCYCGCERSIGHRHLADCFVRSDGKGWDAHAAGCVVCTDESATVRQLIADGADPSAIRRSIIAEFGELAPTPSI